MFVLSARSSWAKSNQPTNQRISKEEKKSFWHGNGNPFSVYIFCIFSHLSLSHTHSLSLSLSDLLLFTHDILLICRILQWNQSVLITRFRWFLIPWKILSAIGCEIDTIISWNRCLNFFFSAYHDSCQCYVDGFLGNIICLKIGPIF